MPPALSCPVCHSTDVQLLSLGADITVGFCDQCDAHFTVYLRQPVILPPLPKPPPSDQ